MTARHTARQAIATIAIALGDLRRDVVFVGGAAAALFDDYQGPDIRATDDVDCVAEIHSVVEYQQLALRLRSLGFQECDDEGSPRCRWVFAGIRVDVMPTEGSGMGFKNAWYPELMKHALDARLESAGKTVSVRYISPLYFIATKIEAFSDRGRGDFFASHDMEDIVAALAASRSVRAEITSATSKVCRSLRTQLIQWRDQEDFRDAALGHVAGDATAYDRLVEWLATL